MNALIPCADHREFRLLNDYQQRFPLCPTPFARVAEELGTEATTVLSAYRRWQKDGVISRIGPVFAPNRVGASTLAALAVPEDQLERVATLVSAFLEVNHNYQREHVWNLWFVVTAGNADLLSGVLQRIATQSGCPLIEAPLEAPYHIDLGFDLSAEARALAPPTERSGGEPSSPPNPILLEALQEGLPLVDRPYGALAEKAGLGELELIGRVGEWLASGLISRFGVVVRHHELGYNANAMCVWDVPAERVDELGRLLATESGINLCYRRRRSLPAWPYNLYCMIHGRARQAVLARRSEIAARLGLDAFSHAVLFSNRRFKQCGARYVPTGASDA